MKNDGVLSDNPADTQRCMDVVLTSCAYWKCWIFHHFFLNDGACFNIRYSNVTYHSFLWILQWNLSELDTILAKRICPLYKKIFSWCRSIYPLFALHTMSLAGRIAAKTVWMSGFCTIWHCILNANSTKIHSSSVSF